MSNYWNNALMVPAPELIGAMAGSVPVVIGTLLFPPVKLIFANQSAASAVLLISKYGGGPLVSWHTFVPGETMIFDDDLYTLPMGTSFSAIGISGNFSISYFYAPQ
jgi:hypothetical protein